MNDTLMKNLFASVALIALAALAIPAATFAQDVDEEQEADDTASVTEEEESLELAAQTVTGSRLLGGDPSVRTEVFTAEEIQARGLSTAEDVIRAIPQNLSTLNNASSLNSLNSALEDNLGALALGVSAANLRGLGSGNTLVLVNGRRIAGNSGSQDFFANLRSVPAAAIERVEVNLDGASAVYGSDALAGVINIILKDNYQGAQIGVRQEVAANEGDQLRIDGTFGYAWNTGSITATISDTSSDPVSSNKAGFTTINHSSRFGGNPDYDFRSLSRGPYARGATNVSPVRPSPWIVYPPEITHTSSPYSANLILASGDGTNAQPNDFRPLTNDDLLESYVLADSSISTDDRSYTIAFEQWATDTLLLRADLLWTRAGSAGTTARLSPAATFVPASNAFNNFEGVWYCPSSALDRSSFPWRYNIEDCEQGVFAYYTPLMEIANGLLGQPYQESTSRQRSVGLGLEYDLTLDIQLVANYSRSASGGNISQYHYSVTPRFEELLASSDPNVAINLFGDGSAQNEGISEYMSELSNNNDESHAEQIEIYARGEAFDLPWTQGQRLSFVLGAEMRSEWLADAAEPDSYTSSLGVPEPKRDLQAAFVELLVPVVGAGSELPGIERLTLNLQARWDDYSIKGADGCEGLPEMSTSYQRCDGDLMPEVIEATFDNLSPTVGIQWDPNSQLTVRIRRTENFRAPAFRDLFSATSQSLCSPRGAYDPLNGVSVPGACNILGANPDLKPEVSTNLSLGFRYRPDWAPGWEIDINYAEIDFTDRIATSNELGQLLPPEVFYNMPEFWQREADGTLIASVGYPVNISRRYVEELDVTISGALDAFGGTLQPGLSWNYVLQQFDQAVEGAPEIDFVGYSVGRDRYKLRFFASWYRGDLSFDLNVFYTPSYVNNNFANVTYVDIPNMDVDSYTVVDLTGTYRFANGLELRAGARNLFNPDIPFVLQGGGRIFDTKRVDLRGRIAFLELRYGIGDF